MTWRNVATIIIVTGLIPATAGVVAQQRDRAAPPAPAPVGSAAIAGRVTTSATSDTPVRRAVVTLIAVGGVDTYSAVADADGRFSFTAVPAGRYTLLAKKGGYLTSSFGAKRPGRSGTTLILAEGQHVPDLRLALPQGGVITGTLRLPSGEPLPNTQVIAVPAETAATGGRLVTPVRFDSDDRGVYRIYGLQPGEYIVGTVPAVRGEGQQRTAVEYDEAVRAVAARQARPPGASVEAATPPPDAPTLGYAPTYFPGTTIAARASRVRVATGEVRDGIDIPVDLVRMSRISGVVRGVDGQPIQAVVISVSADGPPLPVTAASAARTGRPDAQGRFVISNVAPGAYRITARAGGVILGLQSTTMRSELQTEWATADVMMQGGDVEGVVLQLQTGLTFSGSLTAVGQGEPPATWKGARVTIQSPAGMATMLNAQPLGGASSRSAAVNDDGTFEVTGIQPADYEIVVALPAAISRTWRVQSVMTGDTDLRDAPLTFERGAIRDVRIAVTDQRTELMGTLSSTSGQAATDFYIVVFPDDRTLWHPSSPRVRVARPEADGGFTIGDLPAGAYRIAALTDVEDNEWRSSAFLESVSDASIAVAVIAGKIVRQDIRLR